jgi:L-lactate dehydrogenase complex protein LldG
MTAARRDVLARIRAALHDPALHDPARDGSTPDVVVPRAYRLAGEHSPGSPEVLDLLTDRLVDYGAHVRRVPAAQVPDAISQVLAGLDPHGGVVTPDGLDPSWLAGVGVGTIVLRDSRTAPLDNATLDHAAAVVTAVRVAIADTGTIVLDGEPDQGRRAITLLPDVHVCVVHAHQVVQSVPEAVRLLAVHAQRPQTWVSGPSATSDIELDRVEGVHGPRTLHVVLAE